MKRRVGGKGSVQGRQGRAVVRRARARIASVVWCAAVLAIGVSGSSSAAPIISGLRPTGFGYTPGSVGANSRDVAWQVDAWAAGGTFQPGYTPSGTTPYAAYVFESNVAAPTGIPAGWLGGTANSGSAGGLWIGLQNSPFGVVNSPTSAYAGDFKSSMVLSTRFVASESGTASLGFFAATDNAVAFFVGGTITTATNVVDSGTATLQPGWQLAAIGPNLPTIVGGQQVGFGRGFGTLTAFTATATVTAGTNTLYAVVYDSVSGASNWTGLLFVPVPEPSSLVLAGIGCGWIVHVCGRSSRRRRGPGR